MSLSHIRFKNMAEVNAAVKRCHFIEHKVAQDERGFYFTHYKQDPRVVKICEELDAKARANAANRPIVENIQKVGRATRPVKTDGPVHQIREWARANPDATPAEAVDHFVANFGFHPATVKIQLRKVRKGLV